MSIRIEIEDGTGSSKKAKVSSYGQLIVAPLDFNKSYNATLAVNDTAYNLVTPLTGYFFVITDMAFYANQSVSNVADATVQLYEASSSTSTTVVTNVYTTNMVRQDRINFPNTNLAISEGSWLNAKTTDNTVYVTILGYYVKT